MACPDPGCAMAPFFPPPVLAQSPSGSNRTPGAARLRPEAPHRPLFFVLHDRPEFFATDSAPKRVQQTTFSLSLSIYIYIYIYKPTPSPRRPPRPPRRAPAISSGSSIVIIIMIISSSISIIIITIIINSSSIITIIIIIIIIIRI